MSIIYAYPIKSTPASDDLILISDSASSPAFATKQVRVSSLPGGSSSGVSALNTLTGAVTITGGTNVTLNTVGSNIEINATSGGGTPATPLNSVQFNNASAFGGDANLTFTGSGANPDTLTLTDTLDIKGDGTNPGTLKLYCENVSTPHAVSILGPVHSGATPYSIRLPKVITTQTAYSSGGRVLESDASGVLQWIATPTGGSGISFSGATVSGIATFASTSSASVNSEVKLASSGQMTFDGSSGNVGIKYDSGTNTLRVGDIVGNSEIVALYSDGAAKITVSDSDVTVVDTTRFDSGLKFGASGEVLNSYEEGTWTPTSANANTISIVSGDYTRIGDRVFAEFAFTMTGSTTAIISGLPFQGVYSGTLKGGAIMSASSCTSVQGQLIGGQFSGTSSFTFNAYSGSGGGLPTQLRQITSSMYQTSGGTYAGVIIYETTAA